MKGVFTVQQALYFVFGMFMLISVLMMMNYFYSTTEPLSQEIGMQDVLKTVKTATAKVYLQARYFNSVDSAVYMKLPRKVSGQKYRISFDDADYEFCFDIPKEYCEHMYLLDEGVSITADIDSSENLHQVRYVNGTIQVT